MALGPEPKRRLFGALKCFKTVDFKYFCPSVRQCPCVCLSIPASEPLRSHPRMGIGPRTGPFCEIHKFGSEIADMKGDEVQIRARTTVHRLMQAEAA